MPCSTCTAALDRSSDQSRLFRFREFRDAAHGLLLQNLELLMLPLMPLLLGLLAGLSTATPDIQPAYDLISRVFGERAAAVFSLSLDANATCRGKQPPCFGLSADASRVSLTASSMSELTYGIGYYTRFHCGLTVGWKRGGGSHTSAGSWPCHVQSSADRTQINEAVARPVPYTYEDNVCTHSYSYVWYDEARWTAHIDWMALSGINVFLALTGQEEIQYKAFRRFNLSDTQIREFFNGPAYLTWSRGRTYSLWGLPRCRRAVAQGCLGHGCRANGSSKRQSSHRRVHWASLACSQPFKAICHRKSRRYIPLQISQLSLPGHRASHLEMGLQTLVVVRG